MATTSGHVFYEPFCGGVVSENDEPSQVQILSFLDGMVLLMIPSSVKEERDLGSNFVEVSPRTTTSHPLTQAASN